MPAPTSIELRFSSQHTAFGDDSAKDADNLSFLSQLSAAESSSGSYA